MDSKMKTRVQTVCWGQFSGTSMRECGKQGWTEERVNCGAGAHSTWPIVQRLEGRETSELSWVEAMRPELCMFTLTSYWMRVNTITCVDSKKETSCGLTADSNSSSWGNGILVLRGNLVSCNSIHKARLQEDG